MKNFISTCIVLTFLLLVLFTSWTSVVHAASITSAQSGNWNATTTWTGGVVPGNGDSVTLATGDTVTVTSNTVVGPSGTSTVLAVNSLGTSQLIIATSTSFTLRGSYVVAGNTGDTPNVIMRPGSSWIWDASLAASPSSTKYSFTQSGSQAWVFLQAYCTALLPCTVTSNAGGGFGYFTGFPSTQGGGIQATHVNFSNIGDSVNPAWDAAMFNGETIVDVSYSTFNNCGVVLAANSYDSTVVNWSHNVHTNSQGIGENGPASVFFSFASPLTEGGVRNISDNVFDGTFGDNTLGGGGSLIDATVDNNYFGILPTLASTDPWASFQNNFVRSPQMPNYAFSVTGDLLDNFMFADQFAEVHTHEPDLNLPSDTSTFQEIGNIYEASWLATAQFLTGDGVVDAQDDNHHVVILKDNIVLPSGDGLGSNSLSDMIGGSHEMDDIEHNTLAVPGNSGAVDMECEGGCTDPIGDRGTLSNNIFWAPVGTSPFVALNFNIEAPVLDLFSPTSSILDNLRTSNLPATTTPGVGGPSTNQGNSYGGEWSVTPGSSDVVTDPEFVDDTRGLPTFDTAYLKNTAGSTWASHAGSDMFTYGQIVSDSNVSYFGGATINYRVSTTTSFAKSTANSEPGVGSAWHNYWEFASLYDLRNAIASSTMYTDPLNPAATTTAIETLMHWVEAGYAPTNPLVHNAGTDGITIGAELFGGVIDSTPPVVTLGLPTNGSTISGSSVTLAATSTDNVAVAGVTFYYDSTHKIGSEITATSSLSVYSTTFDSTALSNGSHTLVAVSRDTSNNYATSSPITVTVNNVAPMLSLGAPTGTLSAGTTSTNLTLTTNENATCKYSTTAGVAYGSMSSTFGTTGGTSQSTPITGLTDGTSYTYYIRCQDSFNNTNLSDYDVAFSVASPVVVSSGGGGGGGSSGGGGGIVGLITTTLGIAPTIPNTSAATTTVAVLSSATQQISGSSLEAALSALLAELQSLQNQENQLTGTVSQATVTTNTASNTTSSGYANTTPAVPTTNVSTYASVLQQASFPSFQFNHAMYVDYISPDVLTLQKLLNTLGYTVARSGPGSPGDETDRFGAATWQAVSDLQAAVGIPHTGFVGPATRAYLNSLSQ